MFHASYSWSGPQLPKGCGCIGFLSPMHTVFEINPLFSTPLGCIHFETMHTRIFLCTPMVPQLRRTRSTVGILFQTEYPPPPPHPTPNTPPPTLGGSLLQRLLQVVRQLVLDASPYNTLHASSNPHVAAHHPRFVLGLGTGRVMAPEPHLIKVLVLIQLMQLFTFPLIKVSKLELCRYNNDTPPAPPHHHRSSPRSGHSYAKGGTYDRPSNYKITPLTDIF